MIMYERLERLIENINNTLTFIKNYEYNKEIHDEMQLSFFFFNDALDIQENLEYLQNEILQFDDESLIEFLNLIKDNLKEIQALSKNIIEEICVSIKETKKLINEEIQLIKMSK